MPTITSISNPVYASSNLSLIDVNLNTVEFGHVPCTLADNDLTEYIFVNPDQSQTNITNQQLYLNAANNMYGNVSTYTPNIYICKNKLNDAILYTCDFITSQITTSQTKQMAYLNAANILNLSGGIAPTTGPFANSFSNLALTWGMTPNNFVTLIYSMQTVSIQLATLEVMTTNEVSSVNTANQLVSILSSFESSINTIVTTINSSVPLPINNPPAIIIQGINA